MTDDGRTEASWLRAANNRDLITAIWNECRAAVHEALARRQLTRDDAIDLIVGVLSHRIHPPGREKELARLVLDNSFATRESAAGLFATFPPIADLSSLEVEFCTRASTVAIAFGALARFGSYAPASLLLAQAGMVRAASLLASAIDLESERVVQPAVALLCRAIHELWLYVRYLDAESGRAVDALVAAHKWSTKVRR